ncbi:MAG: hypothetical protein V3U64_03535 [Cocleimonas sp.]
MKIKQILLPAISTIVILLTTNIANADNGLTYPSANVLRGYQFPPQAPVAPRFNRMPVTPTPYVFGQNNSQPRQQMGARLIPTPAQANARMPTRPQMMPNNSRPQFAPSNFGSYGNNTANNFNRNNTGNNFPFLNNSNGNSFPFSNSNMMPFGNGNNNGFSPFSSGNMPFSNSSGGMMPKNPMNNMFGNNANNQNFNMPFFNSNNNRKKAWGDKRNIWPDFYTDFTDESWDTMMSSPRKMGRMPGGWRFPYISMPDPVTVSDAIANQLPPIAEEAGNMADFSDWGIFDNK